MTIRTIIAAALLASPAAASLPAPERVQVGLGSEIRATGIAPVAGLYTLDSTFFQLGPDTWGRTRKTATVAAGAPYSFAYRCTAARGLYGYRVTGPGLVGASLWVRCQ